MKPLDRSGRVWASTGATVAGVAALVVAGVLFGPDALGGSSRAPSGQATLPPERHLAVGESETHGNVTVTLVEGSFSSSHSQLVFDIEDRSPSAGESSRPYLTVTPDFSEGVLVWYSGFAPDAYPLLAIEGIGPHATRNTVSLGPVELADRPVIFHIGIVSVEREEGGENVEGPWHFEFVPGKAAVDPVDFDVPVDKSVCGDGICIAVDRMHFSSAAVEVHYRLESKAEGFRGAPGYPVRMIFPDGTWAAGVERSDPNKLTGPEIAAFNPLPEGVREFKLVFGPYLVDLPGPFEIAVPVLDKLPPAGGSVPGDVPLEYATTLGNEDFVVRSLSVDQEGFELALENVNPGAKSVVHNAWGPIEASDDRGNTYHPASLGWALGEDALGSLEGRGWAIRFDGQLDPQAQVLRLTIDRLGRLLYGPWQFDVAVPEGALTAP